MQKRTSEAGFGSEDAPVRDDGPSSCVDELALKPYLSSSSIRSSTCWPGATVRDQTQYATPVSQRGRVGLQSFHRTPYSRAIASKSKTKVSGRKKDSKNGGMPYSEVTVTTVPSHSSQIARKILEHLDRNPATPKEKSAELKLATSWKNPEYSNHNSLPQFGILDSSGKSNQVHQKKSVHWGEDRGKSLLTDPPESGNKATDLNKVNLLRNKKPPTHSTGTKPVLPSISIAKRNQKWAAASVSSGTGFTFQIPASSGMFSEPPTPSMPCSYANGLHQPKSDAGLLIPTYSFGSNKDSPALVFSFPSTSSSSGSPLLPEANSDLKFNFGSDKSPRVSFSSIGKDSICY
ncbi:hypothetical protein LINPERPRIM_LOCUS463 [Linum perenne]